MPEFLLASSAFADGQHIPRKHTGDGADLSPPLSWSDPPAGTRELALIVDDPDAPTPEPWVHWVLYKIPAEAARLPEGVAPALYPGNLLGACQGRNSWPKGIGYRGPAPPKGHGVHRYFFKLFALSEPISLEAGAQKSELLKAISGRVLAQATLMGRYERA
jgi:hypothetical protein